jgi:exopolyphosphatase/guanosine-5'-triphosphate,3'-diphosphate pyrophosphatase
MRPSGVVDVGSNTIRLLVARADDGCVDPLLTRKFRIGLGRDIEETGAIPAARIAEAADAVDQLCRLGRKEGADVRVLVTAPGRQAANADELLAAVREETGHEPEVLSREEEGRLAFLGAVAASPPSATVVAVVDLGGASTEVAVGRPDGDVAWVRSFDLGALRLTTRLLAEEKPTLRALARARATAAQELASLTPPLAGEARAVGGCARALRKVVGETLGAAELVEAVEALARRTHDEIADEYDVRPERAALLVAGAIVLAEVQARLVMPLAVVDGGVREGALLDGAAGAAARVA